MSNSYSMVTKVSCSCGAHIEAHLRADLDAWYKHHDKCTNRQWNKLSEEDVEKLAAGPASSLDQKIQLIRSTEWLVMEKNSS